MGLVKNNLEKTLVMIKALGILCIFLFQIFLRYFVFEEKTTFVLSIKINISINFWLDTSSTNPK